MSPEQKRKYKAKKKKEAKRAAEAEQKAAQEAEKAREQEGRNDAGGKRKGVAQRYWQRTRLKSYAFISLFDGLSMCTWVNICSLTVI